MYPKIQSIYQFLYSKISQFIIHQRSGNQDQNAITLRYHCACFRQGFDSSIPYPHSSRELRKRERHFRGRLHKRTSRTRYASLHVPIQNATNAVRNALTLVAQINFAAFENAETTFADLQSRIALTQRALEGTDAKSFEGAATRTVERQGKPFTGLAFLTQISIPNFYFHISIAYAILRSNGVQLGKQDYLNGGQEAWLFYWFWNSRWKLKGYCC